MDHNNNNGAERDGILTSGSNHSFWIDSVNPLKFDQLKFDMTAHTIVIGGGIAGLSIAYCLAKAGTSVIVLEDGFLGSGETGRTTAHLVNALDDRYSVIENRLGREHSILAAESHTEAIRFIEEVVQTENINCDFQRVPGYLFLHSSDNVLTLEDELLATHRAGLKTEMLSNVPGIDSESGPCLKFPYQAQFHPMKYLRGLAEAITRLGGKIFTETRVTDFKKDWVTANGFIVKGEHIVVATNSPINDLVTMHTKQHPYRTYVIGGLVPHNAISQALWWDTGNTNSNWASEPYHYVRLQRYDDKFDLLIAGGEDHKTGQAEKENIPEERRFNSLIRWTRQRFPQIQDIIYQWSGQVLEPVDCMAFIGRNPGDRNIYIATGDSGNGMTHGSIAGMLISDLILGRTNRWEKLYDPARITLKATGDFLQEVGNMAAQYLDLLSPGDIKSIENLHPGEGAIMNVGLKKTAVYRDQTNGLHAFSAICPHLGCVVRWNGSEKSFDCPCHGSRFTCEGKVVNGPAQSDLKRVMPAPNKITLND
jgi:glycine/D-amino acid oxidase-like deaminating enzyme/nitrite reductase/ring-hydroxylating ferredoxin subunit